MAVATLKFLMIEDCITCYAKKTNDLYRPNASA